MKEMLDLPRLSSGIVTNDVPRNIATKVALATRPRAEVPPFTKHWWLSFRQRHHVCMLQSITTIHVVSTAEELLKDNCWRSLYERVARFPGSYGLGGTIVSGIRRSIPQELQLAVGESRLAYSPPCKKAYTTKGI